MARSLEQHGRHSSAGMSRRDALTALPALAMAPLLGALRDQPVIALRTLHSATFGVTDLKRSVEFYQGLFGLPIQTRHGNKTVVLRVGGGPQFIVLTAVRPGMLPSIRSICVGVAEFNIDHLVSTLEAHGVTRDAGATSSPGVMKLQLTRRGAKLGGANEGTAELFFTGPDNLVVQLQHTNYCAGGGVLGDRCGSISSAPKGILQLVEYNHVAAYSPNADRALPFYRSLFGAAVEKLPIVKIGASPAFFVVSGGVPPQAAPSPIDHACLTVRDFDPERTTKTLIDFGIKEGSGGPAARPLQTYTRLLRGTVELYVSDPDGLLLQLQDSTYCAGSGVLGNACS